MLLPTRPAARQMCQRMQASTVFLRPRATLSITLGQRPLTIPPAHIRAVTAHALCSRSSAAAPSPSSATSERCETLETKRLRLLRLLTFFWTPDVDIRCRVSACRADEPREVWVRGARELVLRVLLRLIPCGELRAGGARGLGVLAVQSLRGSVHRRREVLRALRGAVIREI